MNATVPSDLTHLKPTTPVLTSDTISAPASAGIYFVVDPTPDEPQYLDVNRGGRFKSKNPTVAVDVLESNWIDGAEVLYIGKSNNLRRRINELRRFGLGEPVGHWGGRYLWQLKGAERLQVGWMLTDEFAEVEAELLHGFIDAFGALPFANLVCPSEDLVRS